MTRQIAKVMLPYIASTTQGLGVGAFGLTAVEHRDNVVEFELGARSAVEAVGGPPVPSLVDREVLTVSALLWGHVHPVVLTAWKGLKHLFGVFSPQTFRCKTYPALGIFCMAIACSVSVADALPLAGGADGSLGSLRVLSTSEGVGPFVESVAADDRAGLVGPAGDLAWTAEEVFTADEALAFDASWHVVSPVWQQVNNGVNSGNNPTVQLFDCGVNPEPSRAGNRAEGATTRGRGYGDSYAGNAPTSALGESYEIVWAAWQHAEVESKRLHDNTPTPQSNETSARFAPTGHYATITLDWMSEMRNMGRGRLINILNQKIDDAGMSLRDDLNVGLLAGQPSAGSKDVNSISELIDEDPTADPARTTSIGSVGNANTWWRNKATAGGAFTVADMNTMYNDVSDGSDFPTFLFTGQTPFEYYENSQVGLQRYVDTRVADAGFPTLQYKGSPILWDPQIGNTDEIYFINTKYLQLCTWAGGDFMTTDFVEPANQAAKTAKILWMGQLTCSNRRRCGTLHGITAPA